MGLAFSIYTIYVVHEVALSLALQSLLLSEKTKLGYYGNTGMMGISCDHWLTHTCTSCHTINASCYSDVSFHWMTIYVVT